MKKLFDQIKNHVDSNSKGEVKDSSEEVKRSMVAAEKLCESLLGCTLHVGEKQFVIRMLEIYYGGVGDDAHDWHRVRFKYKKSKFVDHTKVQEEEGFRVYLSSVDVSDTYARMDIVAGNNGVPISFLIRSVFDSKSNRIDGPNKVLRTMGINGNHHGCLIDIENKDSELYLENTHERFVGSDERIGRRRRMNLSSCFECRHELNWNLFLK